jgi:hypothetical protein
MSLESSIEEFVRGVIRDELSVEISGSEVDDDGDVRVTVRVCLRGQAISEDFAFIKVTP